MALQFILGGSGSGKSEYVKKLAIDLATADRRNNILMIVPDQFTMQTQWDMANSHPDGGIINIDVLSFSRLPRKVFEEVGQPKRMLLDDTGKCLLIKRGASKIKDDLLVLYKGMDNAGWAGEVKSVLSEFMQYNVSPEDLDTIKEKCTSDDLKKKISDLKLLYEVFLKECEDKYITREELLDMFIERLPLSKKMEKSVVIFDGFTGFTPIQIKAIVAVLNKAKDVYITFPFDNDPADKPNNYKKDDNSIFNLTKRNMSEIKDKYDPNGINIKDDIRLTTDYRHANNSELAFLEKNLFRKENVSMKAVGAIEINKCSDVDSECHIVCEAILKEIEKKNYRYRDIALICADMTKYRKPLEKYLSRYGIPYYLDANRSIINNPLVKYILSITEILKYNFQIEDVLKMLRTGVSPFEDEEIDRLENYIYARGIKGAAKWKSEFSFTSAEQRDNGENLSYMNSLRERFIGIFEEIASNGVRKRKLSEWIKQIYNILETGNVADKMGQLSDELKDNYDISVSMEYAGIYNKIIELFDVLTDLMGEEDYTIKELSDILKVGFSEIRVGVLPQKVDSVLVGDMQRTRLREIKALFIVGVNDGNIPCSGVSGGLLSVPDKEELKRAECNLAPTSDELAFIEQLYIYLGLTKPTDKLFISFATVGSKGESLIPSYLIEVLRNMYEGLSINICTTYKPNLFETDIKDDTGRLLGLYVSGLEVDEEKLFKNIGILRTTQEGREWCDKVIENAFREHKPTVINEKTAKELYGNLLKVSISTLEQFARCQYAYFVGDGLKLSEREEYGLESMDMGNLAHGVLEEVGKKLNDSKLDFSTAEEAFLNEEIDLAVEKFTSGYNGDLLKSDEKTRYYVKQLARIMKRTAKTLGFQLSKGKYKPEMFEEKFVRNYEMYRLEDDVLEDIQNYSICKDKENSSAEGMEIIGKINDALSKGKAEKKEIQLKGRIDRADVYVDDANNEYVKIIDYKSSKHAINTDMIKEGLSLQLAIYMKKAIESISEKNPDKNVLPAAMLYYAIDDPFVVNKEDYEAEIRKSLIPSGLIVNDEKVMTSLDESLAEAGTASEVVKIKKKKDNTPDAYSSVCSNEAFLDILDVAEDKALDLSGDILAGKIDVNPYKLKNETACKYCALKGICGFDRKIKGYEYRAIGPETSESEDEEEE